jgi:two-component system phosphate regulon response regulator PhoB
MTRPFVLIVEDDEVVRTLLRLTLPAEGYDVVEATDGEHALEVLEQAMPALVLLDWRMPGRSGREVLQEIKRREPETPVIVLSAQEPIRTEEEALAVGANVFFAKPFSPLQLLAAVERLLPDSPLDQRP